jgi:hypothetical protein
VPAIDRSRRAAALPAGALRSAPFRAAHGAPAAAAAAQHLHVVGDDLGGEAVVSLLILPLAGAQFALDEHLRALAQVFRGDLAQAAEQRDAVPLGALLLRPRGLVLPRLAGGDADVGDRHAARHGAGFGIGAQITHQNDLVDAARHEKPLVALNVTYCTRARRPHIGQ